MLTRQQRKLMMFLDSEKKAGRHPTYQSMADHMGFANSAAYRMVGEIHRRGRYGSMNESWFAFDDETKRLVPLVRTERQAIVIRFKQLPNGEGLPTPSRATSGAAGIDLQSADGAVLGPGQWQAIRTGYAVEIPEGMEGQIRPRSGLAARHGLTVLNSPGTLDCDYRGELVVILINHSHLDSVVISRGDRIAQLVVAPVAAMPIECVTELTETVRGEGGFGSTGI